ncbi:hypothetical protein [Geobacter metallireducens]|nr:hypothetical protein [Geobacter metallireducens]
MRAKSILLFMVIALYPTFVAALDSEEKYTGFHIDVYDEALTNKVIANAAKCEVIDQLLNGERKSCYLSNAIHKIISEPDNKLVRYMPLRNNYNRLFIEYEVAYHALRNAQFGALKTMKTLNAISVSGLLEMYSKSNCPELNKSQD